MTDQPSEETPAESQGTQVDETLPTYNNDDEKEERTADILLQHAWQDFSASMEEKRALDSKASYILVADGVFLGFIFNALKDMVFILGISALILLLASCCLCIHALAFRPYSVVRALAMWKGFQEEGCLHTPCTAKKNLMATIDDSIDQNRKQCESIVDSLRPSLIMFMVGGIIALFAIAIPYGMHEWNILNWVMNMIDIIVATIIYIFLKMF